MAEGHTVTTPKRTTRGRNRRPMWTYHREINKVNLPPETEGKQKPESDTNKDRPPNDKTNKVTPNYTWNKITNKSTNPRTRTQKADIKPAQPG